MPVGLPETFAVPSTINLSHRVKSALYLGGMGKAAYMSPLKVAAKEGGDVGLAAKIALELLIEPHDALPANSPAFWQKHGAHE